MSAPTGTITTVSTGWCTTRGHNMQSRWSKAAIFTTRWAAGWQNGYNPADQDSSCWIRVAQAWAGTGFGHLAIPRVGQEVIVDFLNGDPDQPIIMGRTYHHENRTPGSLPGTKTQMTIRSKTYKGSGFNELKFDDATGKEQVYIHAQKNMNTEVLTCPD